MRATLARETGGKSIKEQQEDSSSSDDKVMSVTYFINKLFNTSETTELNEMDVIL